MFDALTLGIDLGTSAIKVMALDAQGHIVAQAEASFATRCDEPKQAEQNPADWLQALGEAMGLLGAQLKPARPEWVKSVTAIGLTGQLPTLVVLGDEGPMGPAVTWRDGRADAFATATLSDGRRAEFYRRTGMPIDGRYLAPMFAHHFKGRSRDVRSILSAKDFLIWKLTGRACTEPSTAAGYGIYDLMKREFSADLAADWSTPVEKLPALVDSNALAGELTGEGARLLNLPEGIAVSSGAADSVCAAYALSGLDEHFASISLGTSAVVIGAARELQLDPKGRCLVTPHVRAGWYGREMDLLASGSGHRWLSQLCGWRDGELDVRAARSPAGARGLIFAPYLGGGEQGALWNPALKGGLFGLTLQHSADDIARAYLEGVCFELRRCVEVLAEHSPVGAVAVSGNITQTPSSAQMLADILGRTVHLATLKSPAALGAAWLARSLSGPQEDLQPRGFVQLKPGRDAEDYRARYDEYCAKAALCA